MMSKSLFSVAVLLVVTLYMASATITYPSSCTDLANLGQQVNGFYMVWNSVANSTSNIYCDFKQWTGLNIADGGSSTKGGVLFSAMKQTSFSGKSKIPFELVRTNVGNAFTGSTGIFTAPVNGYYSFSFNGLKDNGPLTAWVSLFVNNVSMADAYYGGLSGANFRAALSGINTILQLSAGDQVYLFNTDGTSLFSDSNNRYTRFSGSLVQ